MNNTIEILLGGKQRRLKFNQGALEVYQKKLFAITIEQVNTTVVYACIYAGLIGSAYVTEIEPDFTYENVCDWCDEANEVELKAACDLFASTTVYKKANENIENVINNLSAQDQKKKPRKASTKHIK